LHSDLAALRASVPMQLHRTPKASSSEYVGAVYEFSFENLAGEDRQLVTPSVFIRTRRKTADILRMST
jgi:hypothetical protein